MDVEHPVAMFVKSTIICPRSLIADYLRPETRFPQNVMSVWNWQPASMAGVFPCHGLRRIQQQLDEAMVVVKVNMH